MTTIIVTEPSVVAGLVDEMIAAVGREVQFIWASGIGPCPVCSGTNIFCPTCEGNPTVDVLSTSGVIGQVKWKQSKLPESKRYRPEGQYLDGDCLVTIAIGRIEQTVLDKTRKVVVDNHYCTIKGYYYRGEPTRNRVYVSLIEDERSDGSYRV